ncbi:GNAT family N-acetyltransferase [Nocardia cyriacigeorgica]|uniref:GNAT family N-acetyltransferase n=1 Tax=Nocardia cyriacigeorgica TaxID=135487 RepID=UPI00030A4469|nr:GNAT family N-acetyltransferase [Nocardia cyriacigeorgica]MBF6288823.1 GNAT family N-acetyltransferase [Nocardia cyriacigeorgica]MBF6423936.1 GNAT family N-acetyltransferase [Nocardia cyriacigeorgica]BDT88345.1 N-acetyltransferase [Nocardia cyriacigeorgica]BDU07756.1 N-acetyltransferase [Nocardia cyriacigeorgica]
MTAPRPYRIVPAAAEHARGLAECHIVCWREAYRGLVPDHVLDAFDIGQRTDIWTRRLNEYPGRTTVAIADNTVIGFITLGPSVYRPVVTPLELNALYVRSPWYGSGVADDLVQTTLNPDIPCSLWVFEQNPRAIAFYRKYGFTPDGATRTEYFAAVTELRMVRPEGAIGSWPWPPPNKPST